MRFFRQKMYVLAFILIVSLGYFKVAQGAITCPTDNGGGIGCNAGGGSYYCRAGCKQLAPSPFLPSLEFCSNKPAQVACAPGADCSNAASYPCGVPETCSSGYTLCNLSGTGDAPATTAANWMDVKCKLNSNTLRPAQCSTYNYCTEVCSACNAGYELVSGDCVGATIRLDSTSVLSDRLKNSVSVNPAMSIFGTGNVGIGTTTAGTRLTVIGSGNYSIDAGNYRIGNVATPTSPLDAVNKSYLDSAVGTAQSAFWNLNGSNLYASSTSWNVGVGTTTPIEKMQINNGNLFISSDTLGAAMGTAIKFGRPAGYSSNWFSAITPYTTTGYDRVGLQFYTSTSGGSLSRMTLAPTGEVGIGTTNPTARLYVNGTSIFNDVATFTQPVVVSAPILGPHAATKSYVDSTIALATSSITFWGGSVGGHIWNLNSGNVGIGVASPESLFEVERSVTGAVATFDVNTTNRATIQLSVFDNYAQLQSYVRGSSSGYLSINPLGNNVGIGTTNPGSYKLNVNGSTNISGSLNVTGTTTASAFVGPLVGTVSARNVSSGAFGADAGGGNFSFPANVGIGTTAPTKKLEIQGGTTTSGANNFALKLKGTYGGTDWTGILFGATHSDLYNKGGIIFRATDGSNLRGQLQFLLNNTADAATGVTADTDAKMVVDYSGNVGIGTTNPTGKLHVNLGAGSVTNSVLIDNTSASGYSSVTLRDNRLSSSYVGQWGLYGNGVASPNTSNMFFYNTAGGGIGFYVGSGATPANDLRMLINSSGNVGIGTTNPGAYRLKVVGDMAVTGTLQTQTGSDFAEEFSVDSIILPGTVVVMADSGHKSVRVSTKAYDHKVVGIVSDNPSIIAGRIESGQKVVVAMMGVVSVNVTSANGQIEKGDLLTSSNLPGYAMKAVEFAPGTVIGKALEDLSGKKGKIKVLVNLQ